MSSLSLPALAACSAILVTSASPALAKLNGGKIEHRSATDPAAEIARLGRNATPVWIAWKVPSRTRDSICGFGRNSRDWSITLGEEESSWGTRDDAPQIGTSQVEIYAGIENGEIRQLQFASEGCPVQAGDHSVTLLDGVEPAASVAFLTRVAARWGEESSEADRGDKHRRGSRRDLAERALSGLTFHDTPEGPLALVHLAREGAVDELRSQSLFWLAQSGAPDAGRWIREAITRDPDPDVREQGVFALSQLPDSTTALLAVLRESQDRDVKQKALFWLGQSDDPRAMAELERLLTH
ncbi:MAG: HEAT repeat domain-containing protein [Thermoanaerobaculia bacterium]